MTFLFYHVASYDHMTKGTGDMVSGSLLTQVNNVLILRLIGFLGVEI